MGLANTMVTGGAIGRRPRPRECSYTGPPGSVPARVRALLRPHVAAGPR